MKKVAKLICVIIHCSAFTLQAQTNHNIQQIKNGIVIVEAYNLHGAGFCIGIEADTVYIITARHVIKDVKKIIVSTAHGERLPAAVEYISSGEGREYDIALLKVVWPDVGEYTYCTHTAGLGDGVYFYRPLDKTTYPEDATPCYVNGWSDDDDKCFIVNLNNLAEGDSGNAIFTRSGLAGMVTDGSGGNAGIIAIEHIKKVIDAVNPRYWKLCAK